MGECGTGSSGVRPAPRGAGQDAPGATSALHGAHLGQQGGPTAVSSSPPVGNEHHNFRINPSSGLVMRGLRPLDREQNSSHVLEVEAYNTEQGPMRSSVRVRGPGLGWGCSGQPPGVLRQPAVISSPRRAEAGAQEAREPWHGNADGKSPWVEKRVLVVGVFCCVGFFYFI